MPSNKQSLIKKLGSEVAYKTYMAEIGGRSRKPRDTVERLIKRIQVIAPSEGKEIIIKVRKL